MFDFSDSRGWVSWCSVLGLVVSMAVYTTLLAFGVVLPTMWKLFPAGGSLGAVVGAIVVLARNDRYSFSGMSRAMYTCLGWNASYGFMLAVIHYAGGK